MNTYVYTYLLTYIHICMYKCIYIYIHTYIDLGRDCVRAALPVFVHQHIRPSKVHAQLQACQYLYFSTSKRSKLSTCISQSHVRASGPIARDPPAPPPRKVDPPDTHPALLSPAPPPPRAPSASVCGAPA